MDSILRVAAGDSTWSPDNGQSPPLANEAAMAAPDSQVISVEAHCQTGETRPSYADKRNSCTCLCELREFKTFLLRLCASAGSEGAVPAALDPKQH